MIASCADSVIPMIQKVFKSWSDEFEKRKYQDCFAKNGIHHALALLALSFACKSLCPDVYAASNAAKKHDRDVWTTGTTHSGQ